MKTVKAEGKGLKENGYRHSLPKKVFMLLCSLFEFLN